MNPVLAARGLVKTYGDVHALAGVDVDISAGDVLAVVGPSGSGKTTLLHVLSGILRADGGEVFLDGRAIGELNETGRSALRRTAFGFVFQSGMLVAELTAEENAALPMLLAGGSREESLGAARLWLSRLGLRGLEKRLPGQLSGGQAQRVAIARALAHRPRVIFADEPTGALDTRTGQEMMTALLRAAEETGAAVVIVTHDKAIADRALRVVEIQDGRIANTDSARAVSA
ncbi:ABC transporter ATP-binding protein [Lentzea sp. DG1S-22]|uniref:ABC transporter ATP-binding protein n=1 Tax=Lentzea sp. DG1S-22 TaxID=3108822 RepID=UPI002E7A50EB|nr:ABC transporter ATP-binding protein [Lentzea sp. DG1S-22]WVH79636.1 ABC transporter ATP-binding protein [Lentzea sp. DG1S-22]